MFDRGREKRSRTRVRVLVGALAMSLVPIAAGSGTEAAVPAVSAPAKPAAIVAMGDSFISGEAGRWRGNSHQRRGDHEGTDLGREAYGPGGRCHRAIASPITTAAPPGAVPINLACSGALVQHIDRIGPVPELPRQIDQLRQVTQSFDVQTIALSIGGNDLGFEEMLRTCVFSFGDCSRRLDPLVEQRITPTTQQMILAVSAIQQTMRDAGDSDYRIVLISYPKFTPAGADNRVSEGLGRRLTGGCAVGNSDSAFFRYVVDRIAREWATVARRTGIEYLDMSWAFEGKQMCAKDVRYGSSRTQGEWTRGTIRWQNRGDDLYQEMFHPNVFGQEAIGDCLGQVLQAGRGPFICLNSGRNSTPSDMVLYYRT